MTALSILLLLTVLALVVVAVVACTFPPVGGTGSSGDTQRREIEQSGDGTRQAIDRAKDRYDDLADEIIRRG